MERISITARRDWQAKVEAQGLVWHTAGGAPYWNESAYYSFSSAEIGSLEEATAGLYKLFVDAGDYVVRNRLFARFNIPEWCWPLIEASWNAEPPALNYGRFDLGFDGKHPPKLFEFNCDTPTSLLEAAVVQWAWKEEVFPRYDQYTSLHDRLVAKWKAIAPFLPHGLLQAPMVHFAHAAETTGEDAVTSAYMLDTARAAGIAADAILMSDVGERGGKFLDLHDHEIRTLCHLYPWEWLVHEPGAQFLAEAGTIWIEPIWKMIWSNKAILPILWDMAPRHPNLLWASADRPLEGADYVRKPVLSREGANVTIVRSGEIVASTDGPYDQGPTIYQGLYELPNFDGHYPVIGSWVVDGKPAGIGIREGGLVTSNTASFIPHVIEAFR